MTIIIKCARCEQLTVREINDLPTVRIDGKNYIVCPICTEAYDKLSDDLDAQKDGKLAEWFKKE